MTAPSLDKKQIRQRLFHGLADPSRLAILEALRAGPRCVAEIIRVTGLSQPNASNHLACLKACGLVCAVQRGRRVFYRLSSPQVAQLLSVAEELLAQLPQGTAENHISPSDPVQAGTISLENQEIH